MRMDLDTKGKVNVADQFWHRDMELGAPVENLRMRAWDRPTSGGPLARCRKRYHGDWNYHYY
jgi:hypothetical protein